MKKSCFRAAFAAFLSTLIAVSALTPVLALQSSGREGGLPDDANEIVEIPQSQMSVTANSYNPGYPPGNVLDGRTDSIWHSEWAPENDPFPHILTIDLYKKTILNDISITPRLDAQAGRIKRGQIYAGSDPENLSLVTDFTGDGGENPIVVNLNRTEARYVQIHSLEATSANTAVSEIRLTAFSQPEEEGPPTADVPSFMMRADASSYNAAYPPANAIDGNRNTLWHSEWTPENDPFPHVLTIDLQKKLSLHTLTIAPRPDANAGKITKGQIYAGDSLNTLELAAGFTADTSRNPTVVDMDQTAARYIQIVSLEASSANTAIAEVTVSTYDLVIVDAFCQYEDALNQLRQAAIGDQAGNHTAADAESFAKALEDLQGRLNQDGLTEKDYEAIGRDIAAAREAFAAKAKAYTQADLKALAAELEALTGQIQSAGDKTAAEALLERAANPPAEREEIHAMYTEMHDFIQSVKSAGGREYDLSGEWDLALAAYSGDLEMSAKVSLPGTLDTNKKGSYHAMQDISRLSRRFTYAGPATYQKSLYISEDWRDKNISLYMERTRQTRVFINGTEVTAPDSANILPVAQQYDMTGAVRFGQYNTIAIVVDNSYQGLPANGISNSHMATDETQTNWNGILGEFKLTAREPVYIEGLRVYPNEDLKSVKVEADVANTTDEAYTGKLTVSVEGAAKKEMELSLSAGETKTFTISDYAMPANVKLWSEFDRPLYELTAALGNGEQAAATFGMRAFRSEDSSFTINGDKVFLRSEANCAVFPLTGYAPMDEEGWEKLFSTYKAYGVNAVRFHSWCPPDAAFRVADRLGLYLQPELSCWAGGMLGDDVNRNYYTKEAFAIQKEYANHPSFVMLTFGNELGYNGNDYTEQGDKLVKALKDKDPTRLYAPGSNVHFGSLEPTSNADFYTAERYLTANLRASYGGLNGFFNQSYPSSLANYDEALELMQDHNLPVFGFEVGQYQIFPDLLTEPQRYTGALEARNFAIVKERLAEKGYTDTYVKKAIEASGMLSRLAYKAEIEAAMRTEGMDGISLLGIQDFSGQGTALVGMMNAFGDPKPYDFADPEDFSSFFSPVVPLLEIEKFCWTSAETLTGTLRLFNYSQDDLQSAVSYKLTDQDGKVFCEGQTQPARFAQGSAAEAGKLSIPLDSVKKAVQLKLELTCENGKNSYNLWVYPARKQTGVGEVYITEYLDELALQLLEEGGRVLLSPKASKTALPESRDGRFSTAFWSTNDKTQPGTMGLLMDPDHPLFDNFPTDYHTDYQWWAMSKLGRPMVLDSLTDGTGQVVEPLVTVIDTGFGELARLGLLYEAAVGEGKLMVSSMGLEELQQEYPEAKALRDAILEYMNSDAFAPAFQLEAEQIQAQVKAVPGDEKENLASKYKGGKPFLGETTGNQQGGYDNKYADRFMEINDGVVDISSASRAWTDWNAEGLYPNDAEVGVELAKETTVDSVALAFFEDQGCRAPARVRVQYWDGSAYLNVSRQNKTSGFTPGMNTIEFAPVQTDRLLFVMEHETGMAVAVSEMFVYEKRVDPESIRIRTENGGTTVGLNQTLQLYIDTEPDYANNKNVKWEVTDEQGQATGRARVGFDGVLRPSAVGKVVVKASLRSDPSVTASLELTVTEAVPDFVPGDLDKSGEVTIQDVMEACKVLARQSAGKSPTDEEMLLGDLDGDKKFTITDVMEICKILARKA